MTELARQQICYLDTNVFVGAFESVPKPNAPLADFFASLRAMPEAAVTSELTLAERLAPSASLLPGEAKKRLYFDLLPWSDFIALKPITREILLETAELRRDRPRKLKLPDAIHIVTAIKSGCSIVMSADKDLRDLPIGMTSVRPDEAGIGMVLDALRA